jgi:hypothetical protein
MNNISNEYKNNNFMSNSIENFNLNKLVNFFNEIMIIHNSIIEKKNILNDNLNFLKSMYNEFIKQNTKQMFVFCLDSFYFQYKMLNTEMEHICYVISIINNRMYGDYYKLYQIILKQLKEKGIELHGLIDNLKNYPQYKDLATTHVYDFENIEKIHNEIIDILTRMNLYYLEKDSIISKYNENTKVGISISNFINTLKYDNSLLREHIILYCNYVEFFHTTQYEHLNSINNRITEFYIKIRDDIIKNQKNIPSVNSDLESILSINLDNNNNNNNNNIQSLSNYYPKTPKNSEVSSRGSSDNIFYIDNNESENTSNNLCKIELVQSVLVDNNIKKENNHQELENDDSISTISSIHKSVNYVINIILDNVVQHEDQEERDLENGDIENKEDLEEGDLENRDLENKEDLEEIEDHEHPILILQNMTINM